MITYEQIETIVLLHRLTEMNLVDCAFAVLPDFDHTDFAQTATLTLELLALQKRLDTEFKETHS